MSLKNPLKYSKTRLHTDPELLCLSFCLHLLLLLLGWKWRNNSKMLIKIILHYEMNEISASVLASFHILLLFLFIAIQWFNLPHLVYIYSTSSLTCLMRLNIFILQSTFLLMFISLIVQFVDEWRKWERDGSPINIIFA